MLSRWFSGLLLSCLLLGFPLYAQQRVPHDSLEQEIIAHPASDRELLGKSRAVLLESLKAGDTAKARTVLRYMEGKFNTQRLTVLYTGEQLLVNYWLSEFSGILAFARAADSGEQALERIAPDPDNFYEEVMELSRKHEGTLRMNARRSDLAPHERDFVLLVLSDVLGRDLGDHLQQEAFQRKMNDDADVYLTSYGNSEYNHFVRKHIRYVTVKSDYGFGYGLGLGYLALPSTLSRHLGDYGVFSLYAEGTYKMAYASFGLDFGWTHEIPKGFEYNGTWPDGLSVMHTSLLLAIGPILEPGSGFLAIPTVGIGYMDFSPPQDEIDKTGKDVTMSFAAWAIGASFRIPLGGVEASSFITLNAGYRRALTDIEMAKGGYSFFTLGWGMFGRPEVRDF